MGLAILHQSQVALDANVQLVPNNPTELPIFVNRRDGRSSHTRTFHVQILEWKLTVHNTDAAYTPPSTSNNIDMKLAKSRIF